MWDGENFNSFNWIALINKKIDPIITWRPWNPVATKNVDPHTESHIQKGDCQYSIVWRDVKYTPNVIVR